MRAIGPGHVKGELFLIAIAALCLVGAALALIVQHIEPAATTTASSQQEEPDPVPLPAGRRRFQTFQ